MTSLLSAISNKIYAQFPQNEHTTNASKIGTQIQELTDASADTSSAVFKNKFADTKNKLTEEKETCVNALIRLNGEFFQDPASALKKAWDVVVKCVHETLNKNIENRSELEGFEHELNTQPQTDAIETASRSIGAYKMLETRRDKVEARLNEILSSEKAEPEAGLSRDALKNRQQELCGNYYADPNGQLDQAWKKYQAALSSNDGSAHALLNAYNRLETERKNNEILLQRLDSIAPALPERTLEALTTQLIQNQIAQLKKDQESELALAGIDWKKTAHTATMLTLGTVAGATLTSQF